ncbi:hypothetical protein V494_00252 [Pseudogymnoascus sp. VKM F-4513 (FW-928)]|nr:hypothetical protein V494_00252 [Pseudogymnoascus sp. VKM F-4513 (FW-928)]
MSLTSSIRPIEQPKHQQVAVPHQNGTTVPHSLSLPRNMLVYEKLLCNVKDYFEIRCQRMIFDKDGEPMRFDKDGELARYDANLIAEFDSYCFTATVFHEKRLSVEFRRALSKACALVGPILRSEHPRTLACFFEVFIHFMQAGLHDVTSFLRYFIRETSELVNKDGLWGQICQLLGRSDFEFSDHAVARVWECMTDTFDSKLGMFRRLAVSVRLDYMKRVYGTTDHRHEELRLRHLLSLFHTPELTTPRVMLNLAHNLVRQARYDEAQEIAQEVNSLLGQHGIYAERVVEKLECLKIVSRSQFNQGNIKEAELTMRRAIEMIIGKWGIHHSWVSEFKNVLEGWLRNWGRVADADILRQEIDELVGKDSVDDNAKYSS